MPIATPTDAAETVPSIGRVCLVGAGPGDPGLLTVAGLDRLRRADVVVYDALASPRLLAEAKRGADLVDVGKRARHHKMQQDDINALLVAEARAGRSVVRLKGGDPYLFGRGAEEAAACARGGVACEVLPGVTSGLAAPATAGIPVTHRRVASTVTLVTGHEDPTKEGTSVDYRGLALLIARGGTACFYMGVGRLPLIAQQLAAEGLDTATPAAVVQWGTTPRQRRCVAPLDGLAAAAAAAGVSSPAIVVVGEAAGIQEPGLDFFTDRPLFGQRVLVTRTRQDPSRLENLLLAAGADPIEAPTLRLVAPEDPAPADAALRRLGPPPAASDPAAPPRFDALVLTSGNAVDALADRLDALGLDGRVLAGVELCVVGPATAARLHERLRLRADRLPETLTGAGVAEAFAAAGAAAGRRFLLYRADIARPELPEGLEAAGAAEVCEVVAYESRPAASLPEEAMAALRDRSVDWLTFTSAATARNLVDLLGEERALLDAPRVASIGPITSEACRGLGLRVAAEAEDPSLESLTAAMAAAGPREPNA
ncbi:uroporphyrinogen-III C-methyltransferase [Phycisphaera mikurensis]|uniref:uroporphyrinogen-III C-methyltransferase n=1 Tax=Phycisphaera mikurensis TaxID=547188 RepID=UPI0009466220|nr:uroporphyrinogen-III C-methyltransferase [Phycisphaera mikurensis]MBB6441942.1 uroporphyrinogen III methyltransferase/synthase [Phycisphaera mikurensis]